MKYALMYPYLLNMQSSRNQNISCSVTIWENVSYLGCFYIILFHILQLKRFRVKIQRFIKWNWWNTLNWLVPTYFFFPTLSSIFRSRDKLIFISRMHWVYLQLNYSKILNILKMIQNRHSCMGNKDFCVI